MQICPEESEIRGGWRERGGKIIADENCRRIEELLSSGSLREVGRSPDGWDTLFGLESDGSLWERTYPHSEMHGGGPPLLRRVFPEDIAGKYAGTWGDQAPEPATGTHRRWW